MADMSGQGASQQYMEAAQAAGHAAIQAVASGIDAGFAALGNFLDGLTEKVKASGKTEGVDIKGMVTAGIGAGNKLADASPSPVPRSKADPSPNVSQALTLQPDVAVNVASIAKEAAAKFPPNVDQGTHFANADLNAITTSSKIVAMNTALAVDEHAQARA